MGSQHTVYYVLEGTATGWQGVEGARITPHHTKYHAKHRMMVQIVICDNRAKHKMKVQIVICDNHAKHIAVLYMCECDVKF